MNKKGDFVMTSKFAGIIMLLIVAVGLFFFSYEQVAPVGQASSLYNSQRCDSIYRTYEDSIYNAQKYTLRAKVISEVGNNNVASSYCTYANTYLTNSLRYKEYYDQYCAPATGIALTYNYSLDCKYGRVN